MEKRSSDGGLGPDFARALAYAADVHADQLRKGTEIPYVSHLLAVAAIVLEYGGDEEQAIAALLHDAVEDQGGAARLADIEVRFGARVASIVEACSDTDQSPKPPWRERKEQYLAQIADEPEEVLLVAMADKLHNARSILADHEQVGADVWAVFSGGRDGTLWYYRSLVDGFAAHDLSGELARLRSALAETVAELERRAAAESL